ncbi:CYTH domain-containing protein [Breznakia pachnodae]|uniref:Uncharacterized protein YjbK n=1 Tax=Breznakia pachnodae TaxID=265178 RepID=A0ABU0E391_9FIRM|nr:CYTH domain-containing protein [Breznakia pachnodae]MDQ0360965.1 uncharacterized protein YjbK [Breznakia pachnodae]
MEKHIEKEYKVLVTKNQFETLLSHYPNVKFHIQKNHYYDNDNYDIIHQHAAMRIREKEDTNIFTLKKFIDGDLLEFECEVDDISPEVFNNKEIKEVLDSYNIQGPFHHLTTLTTNRGVYYGNGYELCFDHSNYENQNDYEIEYEYTKDHDGETNFQSIMDLIGITYEKNAMSKIQRALHAKGIL